MNATEIRGFLIGTFVSASSLTVLAAVNLPNTFAPNTPIKSAEVNANFSSLKAGVDALEASKQAKITGSPCGSGQFVQGIGADGVLSCAVDQIGSNGNAGVSSLNGKTGSLAVQAGAGVSIDASQAGKIIVNATGGSLSLPFNGSANGGTNAFQVGNNTGNAISGSSGGNGIGIGGSSLGGPGVSGYSENSYGLQGASNTGLAGVYGEGKASGGAGVRGLNSAGPGSSGVWGESAAGSGLRGSSASGTGVLGNSEAGYGVRGLVSQSGTGVYGENSSNTAGAGVQGKADSVNSVGVLGSSTAGTGVRGSSAQGIAVSGKTTGGTAGVSGETGRADGSGIEGQCTTGAFCAGVYGRTDTGVGVWGRNRNGVAVRADGNAVQELGFGGFAKAMVYVDYHLPNPLVRCFNSQQSGALMNGSGCGISLSNPREGTWDIGFGFDTSNRFAVLSLGNYPCKNGPCVGNVDYFASAIRVHMIRSDTGEAANGDFTLIVF